MPRKVAEPQATHVRHDTSVVLAHLLAEDGAREGFPVAVRTLDALHLASARFLMHKGAPLEIASYDERLLEAARAVGIPVHPL